AYNANQPSADATLVLPPKFEQGINAGGGTVPAGTVRLQDSEVVIPRLPGSQDAARNSIAIITDTQGRVLASSVPDVIPAGAAAGKLTRGFMAPEALKAILSSTPASGTLHGKLVWAT